MNLECKLEALLYFKGEPITKKKACTALGCDQNELNDALAKLEKNLEGRGLAVVSNGDEIEMRTAAETGDLIEKLTKDELVRDLGKAGMETLTIILYKHPIKRSEIDYIRGVNSSFILRNLLIRGLIERITERDVKEAGEALGRGYSYKPTIDLLSHLGISKISDLPEYDRVKAGFDGFVAAEENTGKDTEENVSMSENKVRDESRV